MWRRLSILFHVMFCFIVASAQNDKLELQLANNAKISLTPGVTANVLLKLINHTNNDEQVLLNVDLPKGWKCFSVLNAITAPNTKTTLKILSINVPSYTIAGNFFISIEAQNKNGEKMGELKLPVTVEPKYALNIELIGGPEYVFAHDTFSVQFMIQNLSNKMAEIKATLKGVDKDEKINLKLKPDSSVVITRKIVTEKGILKSVKKNITLTALIAAMPDVMAEKSYTYNVIPFGDVKFDPYDRLPVQFSTFFVSDNPGGERLYALMYDVEGKGFLDDKNTKAIHFHFQGPDRRGKTLYSIYDEYFINYSTSKSTYFLGDHTYRLTNLTESARYGRGTQAEHTFSHFTIGSFINFPRFYPKIKREAAVYAAYSPSQELRLNVGYLNKLNNTGDYNHLATLSGVIAPLKWAKVDFEYAVGTVGSQIKHAFKTEMTINYHWLHLFYNYTMAEKDYPGYYSDTRFMVANGSINLSKKINIAAHYSDSHQNMALDTLYGNAPFSKNIFFSFNHAILKNGNLSASYNYREQQDRMKPMKFNYNEKTMRLGLYKGAKNFGVNVLGEYGKIENLLLPENERLNDMYRGQLSMNYQVFTKLNFSSFLNYQKSNRYLINNYEKWVYGGSANGSISKKLNLSLHYQSSYTLEESFNDRNILDGRLNYVPNKNNRIEISSRYDLKKNSLDDKQLAFAVKYVHTFNLPVRKKKNIGKLSGRIINKGVNTVAGIILSIGSDRAVTDKNGNFSFPILPADTYYLMIDYSKAGINAIPEIPSPYRAEILPGTDNKFEVGLTQTAKVTGELLIEKEVSDKDKTYAPIKDQLGKLLIEAKSGNEVFRIFTKDDGKFLFEGLRPGVWTVKVYENGMPKEYELVTSFFNLVLASGQTEHIQVKIRELRRRVKFQQSVNTNAPLNSKQAVQQSDKTNHAKLIASALQTNQSTGKNHERPNVKDSVRVKQPTNPKSLSNEKVDKLEYRIQIGNYSQALASTSLLAEKLNISEKIKEDIFDGNHIYTIGSYKTQIEAIRKNKEFQKTTKMSNSFIVSFRNGKRTIKLEKP